jgi:hypothetical protein
MVMRAKVEREEGREVHARSPGGRLRCSVLGGGPEPLCDDGQYVYVLKRFGRKRRCNIVQYMR